MANASNELKLFAGDQTAQGVIITRDGNATVQGTLTASNLATLSGGVTVTGGATLNGGVTVTGGATLNGLVTTTSDVNIQNPTPVLKFSKDASTLSARLKVDTTANKLFLFAGGATTAGMSVDASGNVVIDGRISASTATMAVKNFDIPHPDPAKQAAGWRLSHRCVEGEQAQNIYKFRRELEAGENRVALPDYFPFLNTNFFVFVTPLDHFGNAYGKVEEATLIVTCQTAGYYNLLVVCDRKDLAAVSEFEQNGVEYLKPPTREASSEERTA